MKPTLIAALLLLFSATVNGQETTTVFDLSGDTPRIVSQQSRDLGMIYIQHGNQAVLQTFPKDYYYGGWSDHRTHYYYGRSYRGYNRNR